MSQLSIHLPETPLKVTPEEFAAIAAANPDLKLERGINGELIVNPPTGGESSRRNLKIGRYLDEWTDGYGGVCFDSSGGFDLPHGGIRAPDASWIRQERWDTLTEKEKEGFVPLCPDFVVELRSPSDSLSTLQDKMREYMANGAQLGWLIDPQNQQVEVYRLGGEVEVLEQSESLPGEDVLPRFVLPLSRIWK